MRNKLHVGQDTQGRAKDVGLQTRLEQVVTLTYNSVKDEFRFTERDAIAVKGKGKMSMYFVGGER